MQVTQSKIPGALVLVPTVHHDHRGFFKETFRAEEYRQLGIDVDFVQDNISFSTRGVLRGLHYDVNVSKLVQVVFGRTYHVIADMRPASPAYLQWEAFEFSHDAHKEVFVPAGVANGFVVLSDIAYVHYKQGTYWNPASDRTVRWDDPILGVTWPIDAPVLSAKDRDAPRYELGSRPDSSLS